MSPLSFPPAAIVISAGRAAAGRSAEARPNEVRTQRCSRADALGAPEEPPQAVTASDTTATDTTATDTTARRVIVGRVVAIIGQGRPIMRIPRP